MQETIISSPDLIELKNISHQFSAAIQPVLSGISLKIPRGKFVTLLGPSGCGKSTLLRMLANLLKPSQGSVEHHFTNPTKLAPISFVFQDPRLLPWRNIWENIALPFELSQKPADMQARIHDVINSVGLTGEEEKRPSMLSGGMRMRVSLARALVTQPELILLDEPFAPLDELLRQELNLELLKLWQQNQWSVVFVTHNISEAVFLSQIVHVMGAKPGRIIESFEIPFELKERLSSSESGSIELRHSSEFPKLVKQITQIMKHQR